MPYHLFNVLLLVGTGLFAYGAWHSLTTDGADSNHTDWPAFTAGALFVVWSTHSESVSWVSGMTDGVAIFFAAAAMAAYSRHLRRPSAAGFTLTIVLLWLGLLGKEAVAAWIPILMILGGASYWKRGERRRFIAETCVLAAVGGVYVAWRTHVIGQIIGGYGAKTHLNFVGGQFVTKLSKHLANAFLPFNRTVALWEGYNLATLLTAILCVGSLALLLRRFPKRKETPNGVHRLSGLFTVAGAIWVALQYIPDYARDEYGSRIWIAIAIVMAIAGVVLFRGKVPIRFDTPRAFLFVSLLTVGVHSNILVGHPEWHIVLLYLAFAYLTRPVREVSEQESTLIKLGLVFFVGTFLAIGPTATLRIDYSGEGSRFSYGPSLFGAFTMLCVALLYLKDVRIRTGLASVAILGSMSFLFTYNIPWAAASDISAETTRVVRGLLPARRIYVLCAPGTLTSASLFRIGLEDLPDVTLDDSKVQIHPGTFLAAAIEGDNITARQVGPSVFGMALHGDRSKKRAYEPFVEPAETSYTEGWFSNGPAGNGMNLEGYNPATDHVIVIDCESVHVIR